MGYLNARTIGSTDRLGRPSFVLTKHSASIVEPSTPKYFVVQEAVGLAIKILGGRKGRECLKGIIWGLLDLYSRDLYSRDP